MKTTLKEAQKCPSCGKPMPAGALAGFCPACLLAHGGDTESGEDKSSARFQPPSLGEIAKLFPQLEILGLLGTGGMGAVYKARQPALDRIVALKVLPAAGVEGANFEERFNREARALARLSHPNIVGVHEFGQAGTLHFFIMEFVDGANLRQLERAGRLSPREALQLIPQICDALQYAHDEGVVHRDIKPENVLVDRKGRVKIADFGLAKILGQDAEALRLTREGQVMGTPHYMAPEQVEKPLAVDHRADIYSLGVVLYEMLTGDLPIGKFSPPSRKVQVDVRLDEVVLRALENDPERRFQHASEVKSQVETIAATPTAATPASPPASVEHFVCWMSFPVVVERDGRRRVNRKGALKAFGIVFGVLTLAFLFVSLLTGRTFFGWLGISGGLSLAARLLISALLVIWGVWRAWSRPVESGLPQTPNGTNILPSTRRGWKTARDWVVSILLMILAWNAFIAGWPKLTPWLRAKYGKVPVQQMAVRDAGTGALVAKLPNGGTMELLALADAGAAPDQFWRPDGAALAPAKFEIKTPGALQTPGLAQKDLVFRFSNLPEGLAFPTIKSDPGSGYSTGDTVWRDGQLIDNVWPVRMAWQPSAGAVTMRLGVAFEAWRTMGSYDAINHSTSYTRAAGDPDWQFSFHHATERGELTDLTYVRGLEDEAWQTRVVAIDRNGAEHKEISGTGTSADQSQMWTYTFNIPLAQIREFRAQIRKNYWVEFRDVALHGKGLPLSSNPPQQTDSQVAVINPQTGTLTGKIGHSTLELLAVADPNAASNEWWRPDGTRIPNTRFTVEGLAGNGNPNARSVDFIFRITGEAPRPGTWAFEFEPDSDLQIGRQAFQDGVPVAGGWPIRLEYFPTETSASLGFGYCPGPWRAVLVHQPGQAANRELRERGDPSWPTKMFAGNDGPDLHVTVELGPRAYLSDDGLNRNKAIVPGPNDRDWRMRVVVMDTEGVEHHQTGVTEAVPPGGTWTFTTWTMEFASLALSRVKEVRLEVQRVQWLRFRDVALRRQADFSSARTAINFGPVIERTFGELLDLDTGKTGEFPKDGRATDPFSGIALSIAWMQEHGFDVAAGVGQLDTVGMKVVELSVSDWETLTPADLLQRLADQGRFSSELNWSEKNSPTTFGFRTREGGTGLLRILSLNRNGAATVQVKRVERSGSLTPQAQLDSSASNFAIKLPSGGSVELLALSASDGPPQTWWRPDGTLANEWANGPRNAPRTVPNDSRAYDLLFRLKDLPLPSTPLLFEFDGAIRRTAGDAPIAQANSNDSVLPVQVVWPKTTRIGFARVGIPLADWHVIGSYEPFSGSFSRTQFGDDPKWEMQFQTEQGRDNNATSLLLVFGAQYRNWNFRLLATRTGRDDVIGVADTVTLSGASATHRYVFPGLKLAEVANFKVETQRLHWAEFANITLNAKRDQAYRR